MKAEKTNARSLSSKINPPAIMRITGLPGTGW